MKNALNLLLLFVCLMWFGTVLAGHFLANELWIWIFAVCMGFAGVLLMREKVAGYSFSKSLLIFMFVTLIFIPFVGKKQTVSLENRTLAPFPEWRWSNVWKFFFQYQVYFEDRFAYRNEMIAAINKVKLKLFHKSSTPDLVAVGKNDWLYMARLDYIEATSKPYTEQQLDTIILNLEIITRYLESKQIKYYFMMIPVKERIYPEYLPELQRLRMKVSKRDQIYERLKSNAVIRNVDCKQVLIDGKKVKDTYYKTDTHWNMFGAFLGYQELMRAINADFPLVVPHTREDFIVDSVMQYAGDLQKMMGFTDVYQFKKYTYKLKSGLEPETFPYKSIKYPKANFSRKKLPVPQNGLKLFLVRDSFSEHLKVLLAPHFDTTVLAWMPQLPVSDILAESPDLVVHEITELFTDNLLKLPDEILQDTIFIKNYKKTYLK